MAHLKKGGNGHLLKSSGGHLVVECPPEAENTCNDCDPPIPDTLYVTVSGLGGDLSAWNGTHEVNWTGAGTGGVWNSECTWEKDNYYSEGGGIFLGWHDQQLWVCFIGTGLDGPDCHVSWTLETDQCSIGGEYTYSQCQGGGCADGNTCADSAGASCTVSLSMP